MHGARSGSSFKGIRSKDRSIRRTERIVLRTSGNASTMLTGTLKIASYDPFLPLSARIKSSKVPGSFRRDAESNSIGRSLSLG